MRKNKATRKDVLPHLCVCVFGQGIAWLEIHPKLGGPRSLLPSCGPKEKNEQSKKGEENGNMLPIEFDHEEIFSVVAVLVVPTAVSAPHILLMSASHCNAILLSRAVWFVAIVTVLV